MQVGRVFLYPKLMENIHVFTVSEINKIIKDVLEEAFSEIWVEGEISNLKNYSNNLFFTLKDQESQIRAVLFRSYGNNLKFVPRDGMKVIVKGKLTLYETRGEYQLVANYMEPLGIGVLKLRFEELKKKLEAKGYFDEARKRALPFLPTKIGIVTSPKGAAIRDILHVLKRRFYNLHVIIFPAKVQGEGAALEIASAINFANKEFKDVLDVLIVARGGGSFEDLFAFNEEVVAYAIYNSYIPVISAVGHETDFTIADFTADLRAPTPSAAAEIVVHKKEEIEDHIHNLFLRGKGFVLKKLTLSKKRLESEKRALKSPMYFLKQWKEKSLYFEKQLGNIMKHILEHKKNRLVNFQHVLAKYSPKNKVLVMGEKLKILNMNLQNKIFSIIRSKKEPLSTLAATLDATSPLKILSRGYSITKIKKNDKIFKILKNAEDVNEGDELITILYKGEICSTVTNRTIKK